jgi:hypothetical protein
MPAVAVQGRWSGECGEAWTGRKNCCCSLRGEGMKSGVRIGDMFGGGRRVARES